MTTTITKETRRQLVRRLASNTEGEHKTSDRVCGKRRGGKGAQAEPSLGLRTPDRDRGYEDCSV